MFQFKNLTGLQRRWFQNCVSILFGLVIVLVGAVILFMSAYNENNVRSNLQKKASVIASMLQTHYSRSEYYTADCISYTKTYIDQDVLELQFLNPNGDVLSSSSPRSSIFGTRTPDFTQAMQTLETASYQGRGDNGERYVAVSVPLLDASEEPVGALRFVASLKEVERQMLVFSIVSASIGLAFIVCIILVSRYFLQTIVRPITDITATAKRIASGSYGIQISRQFNDEIGDLADTVNDMSLKISQAEKTQTEFISSVSHELRTPLTAISGWGETLLCSENLDPEMRRGIVIILREARRLTGMVEELLEFTRMQNGRFTLNVEQADILAEFEDTVFMYGSRLKQEEITLNYVPDDTVIPEIPCDVSRMRQVFLNILDNAAKHGGAGKQIDASIALEEKDVVIRIRDYGPGIPEEELPHVKMKFYKGSSKARGSGIGLAVCEEIITMHGGTLVLENAEGGGTLVTIRIPSGEE